MQARTRRRGYSSYSVLEPLGSFKISLFFFFTEFEGQVEYSCKVFAERKEKLKLSSDGDGPLVNDALILCTPSRGKCLQSSEKKAPRDEFLNSIFLLYFSSTHCINFVHAVNT